MPNLLFISVNQTFREDMDLAQLEACAAGNWDITVAKASACERVVAVKEGWPLGAWRLRGAFVSDCVVR